MSGFWDDLRLEADDEGVRLRVRVAPGARREGVEGVHGGALKVAVRAPPERGRANDALVDVLARTLGVPRGAVRVLAGASRRDKVVAVRGFDVRALRAHLASLAGHPP